MKPKSDFVKFKDLLAEKDRFYIMHMSYGNNNKRKELWDFARKKRIIGLDNSDVHNDWSIVREEAKNRLSGTWRNQFDMLCENMSPWSMDNGDIVAVMAGKDYVLGVGKVVGPHRYNLSYRKKKLFFDHIRPVEWMLEYTYGNRQKIPRIQKFDRTLFCVDKTEELWPLFSKLKLGKLVQDMPSLLPGEDKNWKQSVWLPIARNKILLLCKERNDWVQKADVVNAILKDPQYSKEISQISINAREERFDVVRRMIDWLDARLTELERGSLTQDWLDFIAEIGDQIERKRVGKYYAYNLRGSKSSFGLKYWIFIGKDGPRASGKRTAIQIYSDDMRNHFWGINEKAKSIDKLKIGHRVVFYLGDSGGKSFYGTATLGSPYLKKSQAKKRRHKFSGVELVNIDPWDEPKPLDNLFETLKFIKNKADYRQYLRGSVHEIDREDYAAIVGVEEEESLTQRIAIDEESDDNNPELTESHELTTATVKKRSEIFRRKTRENYAFSCAVCGSSRFSRKGTPEAEAAHIYPVFMNSSNDLRNGICLCKLHHWAFENGLFTIKDNYSIVIEKRIKNDKDYEDINRFENRKIRLPEKHRPHPKFLKEHRKLHVPN